MSRAPLALAFALLLAAALAWPAAADAAGGILYVSVQQRGVFSARVADGGSVRVEPDAPVQVTVCVAANATLAPPEEAAERVSVQMSAVDEGGAVRWSGGLSAAGVASADGFTLINMTATLNPPRPGSAYTCTVKASVYNGSAWTPAGEWTFTVSARTQVERAVEKTVSATIWAGSALVFLLAAVVAMGSVASKRGPSMDDVLLLITLIICVVIGAIAFGYYFQLY